MRQGAGNDGRPCILGAFPAVGCAHPDPNLSDDALQEWLADHYPHWIVQFEVVRSHGYHSDYWFEGRWIERLAQCLGLSSSGFRIEPRESTPFNEYRNSRPVIYRIADRELSGTSYGHAVAVSLKAASDNRPLPSWLLLSGALADEPDADLKFRNTLMLQEKIKLALGLGSDYHLVPLLERIHDERTHDRREARVVSGQIKLFIIPTDVNNWRGILQEEVEQEILPEELRIDDLGAGFHSRFDGQAAPDFEKLKSRVEELADGGMLVVEAPTVWHTLRLLGFEVPPDRVCGDEDVRVYRVNGRSEMTLQEHESQREQQVKLLKLVVETRLRERLNYRGKLGVVLERIRAHMEAAAAYIALQEHSNDRWLNVIECRGLPGFEFLERVPAEVGFNAPVLKTGNPLMLTDRKQCQPFLDQLLSPDILPASPDLLPESNSPERTEPPPRKTRSLYSAEEASSYRSLFKSIWVCMTVPLKASGRPIGVLCLLWNEPRHQRNDHNAKGNQPCSCVDCLMDSALLRTAADKAEEIVAGRMAAHPGDTPPVPPGDGDPLVRLDKLLSWLEKIDPNDSLTNLTSVSLENLKKPVTVTCCLEVAGSALKVDRVSLFVRDSATGHFLPFLETDEKSTACFYAPGEGCTGFVVQQGRALLLDDCGDPQELAAKGIGGVKYHPDFWRPDRDKLAYLGVPILVGEDVLGVLRFLCLTPRTGAASGAKSQFSNDDRKLAEAAAARLARLLRKLQEHRDAQIWKALYSRILQASNRLQLCQHLHQALEWRVGRCRCLVRLLDKRERREGSVEEVLDRWFVNDHSDSLWPPFRTRDDPDSGWVWREGRTRGIADVAADRARRLKEGHQPERWMDETGCAVIAPMNFNRELVGILAVARDNPRSLLPSDVKFVEQVAELAGPAFVTLAKTEELRVQDKLNYALIEYFSGRLDKQPLSVARSHLLQEINTALVRGLGAAAGYVWRVDDISGNLLGVPYPDGFKAPQEVRWSELQQELGDRHFVVVSEVEGGPNSDGRLQCLLDALPNNQGERYQNCQRACILLPRTEHLRVLHPALFFLVVLPPQRLSYDRVEHLFRMLVTSVIHRGDQLDRPL